MMTRNFKNLKEVAAYLKDRGWKVAQSTVYKHAKEGLIRPEKDGTYSLKKIHKYARLLKVKETEQRLSDEERRQEKERLEIERLRELVKRERYKRMKEEGEVVLKSEEDLRIAGKLAVLENGLKGRFMARAGEYVSLVRGDEKLSGDLARSLLLDLDMVLNEFASSKKYVVVLKANERVES